jgi:hypothetical protein
MLMKSSGVVDVDKEVTDTFSSHMRKLNKEDPEKAIAFMKAFKEAFDNALDNNLDNHQDVALLCAKESVANIKEDRLLKFAQATLFSKQNPQEVGASLARVINILMDKLPHDKAGALQNMRGKLSKINPTDIALSNMPETAAYGQSITLVKTLLNGYSPKYIQQVLHHTIQHLN